MELPIAIKKHIEENSAKLKKYSEKLAKLYENCFASTIETALGRLSSKCNTPKDLKGRFPPKAFSGSCVN